MVCGGYVQAWKEGNHLDVFWANCVSLIKNFLERDYDVVFNYIISKDKIEELKEIFKEYQVKFIVLVVDEETIIKRDKLRPDDCQMGERCLVLLNNIKKQKRRLIWYFLITALVCR